MTKKNISYFLALALYSCILLDQGWPLLIPVPPWLVVNFDLDEWPSFLTWA